MVADTPTADTPTYESLAGELSNPEWQQWQKRQKEPVHPDLALRLSYNEIQGNLPTTIRRYSDGSRSLYYINASHGTVENQPTTHKIILEAIERFKPAYIILEGTEHTATPLPVGTPGMSEVDYAIAIAHERNIPVIWGEPSEASTIAHLNSQGFSHKDIMAYYLVRALPYKMETFSSKYGKGMIPQEIEDASKKYFAEHSCFDSIPKSERLTFEEFSAHYAPILGNKELKDIRRDDAKPSSKVGANIYNEMALISGEFRDRTIIERTTAALNEKGTALKIYGASHREVEDPMWNAALGQGVDIEPTQRGIEKSSPSAAR